MLLKWNSDSLCSAYCCTIRISKNTQRPNAKTSRREKTRDTEIRLQRRFDARQPLISVHFIKIYIHLCALMRKTSTKQSSDWTLWRHISPRLWTNCNCSKHKTPLQQPAEYKSNNCVNKCMFHQQFEESLSPPHLSKTLFLLVSCLPSNMWQEFKKLGRACCTVRRGEFTWGYDSGFGSAANFWHCSPQHGLAPAGAACVMLPLMKLQY